MFGRSLSLWIIMASISMLASDGTARAQSPAEFQKLLQRIERLEEDVARRNLNDDALRKRLDALSADIDQVLQSNDARLLQIESGLKQIINQQGRMIKVMDSLRFRRPATVSGSFLLKRPGKQQISPSGELLSISHRLHRTA